MLTSKQRAFLRGLANTMDSIFQIGKLGVTPEVTEAISNALEARELVKITVLKNCLEEPKEIASVIAGRTRSDVVQTIGRKFVLYRQSKDHKTIDLPK